VSHASSRPCQATPRALMSERRDGERDDVERPARHADAPRGLIADGPDVLERLEAARRRRDSQLARRVMTQAKLLVFLDLDGVLRREHAAAFVLEAPLRERFETTLRSLRAADVVISSGWREAFALSEVRGHFSEDFRPRIVGATPIASPAVRARTLHYRYREVMTFMRRPEVANLPWVALDDDEHYYPKRFNVRVLDPSRGFDEAAADWLLDMGARYGASA
jgi:hypothetical protein